MKEFYDQCGKKWIVNGTLGLVAEEPSAPAPQPKTNKRKYERRIFMTRQYSISEVLVESLKALKGQHKPMPALNRSVLAIIMDEATGLQVASKPIYNRLESFYPYKSITAAISVVGKYLIENRLAKKETHKPEKGRGYNLYTIDPGIKTSDPDAVGAVYEDLRTFINKAVKAKRQRKEKAAAHPAPIEAQVTPRRPLTTVEIIQEALSPDAATVAELDKNVGNLSEVVARLSARTAVLEKAARSDLSDKARAHIVGLWDAIEVLRERLGVGTDRPGNRQTIDINVNFRLGGGGDS